MDTETIKKKVKSGFVWESITKFIAQTMSWASTIIVARLLLPEDYGIVAISGIFIGILSVIGEMGLTAGLIYRKDLSQEEEDAVFWLSIGLSLGLYLVLYVAAPFIEDFYAIAHLEEVIRLSGFVFLFSSLKVVPMARTLRELDFKYRSSVEMLSQIVNAGTAITMATLGFGFWSLICSTLAGQLFATLAYLHHLHRFPRVPNFKASLPTVSFGSKMVVSSLLGFVTNRSGTFVIGTFLGEHNAGQYSLANTIAQIPLEKIGSIFNVLIFPATARLHSDREAAAQMFLTTHKALIAITYPALIGCIIISQDFVKLLFGDQWIQMAPILSIICALNLVKVSAMLLPATLEGYGNVNAVVRYNAVGAVLTPIALLIGTKWGLMGVAWALLAVQPCLYSVLLYSLIITTKIKLSSLAKSSAPVFVACGCMAVAALLCRELSANLHYMIRLALTVTSGISAYVACFFLFFRADLAGLTGFVKGIRK